jgi:hypothetical protein
MIEKTNVYETRNTILIGQESYYIALPARVTNTDVAAVNGKKILKAGTPLSGDITARGTAMAKAKTTAGSGGAASTSNAVAVLLHDVDVTAGANNATILLAGCVDLLKLDASVVTLIDDAAKTALKNIIFVKGSAI